MILHRSFTYFLFVLNFHVGLLLHFLPENRDDVIYFSQNHLGQWKKGGKVDDVLVNMNGHVTGDDAGGHGGEAPYLAAPAAETVPLPAAFISGRSQGHERNARAATANEGNCGVSGDKITRIINNKFHFNDSNFNLALLWTGPDSKELLALTTLEMGIFAAQSHLWLSLDYGKTFTNIDDRIEGAVVRRQNGIFKSPLDPQRVVLISYLADNPFGTKLYLSKNGGRSFSSVTLDFFPEGKINFHPTHPDLMFVTTPNDQHKVWLSRDFGLTWKMLKADIEQATWASPEMDAGNDLLLLQYEKADEESSLLKTSDLGKSYQTLQRRVQNFGLKGKFIYAAIDSIEGVSEQHVLHVSIDKGHTWSPTQLPVITSDRFFSVLDASEGLIFMHVDDPGNTGTGTIYTSSSDGIVFSESLEKHLFPNQQSPDDELITDFYRVDSMRGVYLASIIHQDQTIHTVITYDRGGIWLPIKKPDGLPCTDSGECTLQIHNQYSQMKHINVPSGPISHSTATGLILAHGTVANGLELRPPDVFVSSDGGYNWRQALAGPHHYAITNSGGLLLAVPASEEATNIIKFSYDEGHCWNSFQFSDETIKVTGLLPEPSRKSLNVSIWGFGSEDSEWRSFMIDFGAILERECTSGDFVEWKPHENNDQGGCLLGLKESFRRIRPDSLCRVNFNFEHEPLSSEHCQCVKADYECDYGFYRPENSEDCVLSSQFLHKELEYCEYGHEEELKTWGYRKIPGDVCEGGYQPKRDVEKLKAKCGGATGSSHSHSAALGVVITLLILLLLGLLFILYRKKKFTCLKNGMTRQYQYNVLSQGDSADSEALDLMNNGVQGYHDDSDEDMLD